MYRAIMNMIFNPRDQICSNTQTMQLAYSFVMKIVGRHQEYCCLNKRTVYNVYVTFYGSAVESSFLN